MTALVLVEAVVLAVLTVLVAGLLRAYGSVLQRLHELDGGGSADGARTFDLLPMAGAASAASTVPAASAAPASPGAPVPSPATAPAASVTSRAPTAFAEAHDLTGETLDGQLVSARVAGVEHDTLLLFLSSGCSSCEVFWDELRRPPALPATTRLLVVPQSAEDESLSDLVALAPPGIDVVLSSDAWRDYEVPGSPHVVFVDGASGRVRGEGTGQSLRQVGELLARSTGDAAFVGEGAQQGSQNGARKPRRDAEQEALVDRELLAAGIVPGDPRLYGGR